MLIFSKVEGSRAISETTDLLKICQWTFEMLFSVTASHIH